VTELRSDALADRYGTPSPVRRRVVIAVSGVVGVVALIWVVWSVWAQSTPDVQSSLRSYDVVDAHSVNADVLVKRASSEVSASCLVRAFGLDHSVVGEVNFKVADGPPAIIRSLSIRTEREATGVELIGCPSTDQDRPR
jgi:hypothetical protein